MSPQDARVWKPLDAEPDRVADPGLTREEAEALVIGGTLTHTVGPDSPEFDHAMTLHSARAKLIAVVDGLNNPQ